MAKLPHYRFTRRDAVPVIWRDVCEEDVWSELRAEYPPYVLRVFPLTELWGWSVTTRDGEIEEVIGSGHGLTQQRAKSVAERCLFRRLKLRRKKYAHRCPLCEGEGSIRTTPDRMKALVKQLKKELEDEVPTSPIDPLSETSG